MGQFLTEHLPQVREGVNHQIALVYEEVDGMRKGLELTCQRYGALRDFSHHLGNPSWGRGHYQDADTVGHLTLEADQGLEESLKVDREVRSLSNSAVPSSLPPVPLRKCRESPTRLA